MSYQLFLHQNIQSVTVYVPTTHDFESKCVMI